MKCKHRTTYIEYTYAGNFLVCVDCVKVIKTFDNDDISELEELLK